MRFYIYYFVSYRFVCPYLFPVWIYILFILHLFGIVFYIFFLFRPNLFSHFFSYLISFRFEIHQRNIIGENLKSSVYIQLQIESRIKNQIRVCKVEYIIMRSPLVNICQFNNQNNNNNKHYSEFQLNFTKFLWCPEMSAPKIIYKMRIKNVDCINFPSVSCIFAHCFH